MKSMIVILKAVRSPVEGIVGIFSSGLLVYALYLASPWYHANYNVTTAALQRNVEYILAATMMLASLPGLVAPFIRKERRHRSLKLGTFGVFMSFLFLTVLRVIVFGWIPLSWLPLLMISLASAFLHIWLTVRKE
jgi:hypothetical protein